MLSAGRLCTSPPPHATAASGRRLAVWAVWALALLVAPLPALPAARADGQAVPDDVRGGRYQPGAKREFRAFVTAWTARDPARVVALVPVRGTLGLSLLRPRTTGTLQRAHAVRTLKGYFNVTTAIHLKDVTKPNSRGTAGYLVRQYDYTYAPQGSDRVTTRLTVTMKLGGRSAWFLSSVAERARPRQ